MRFRKQRQLEYVTHKKLHDKANVEKQLKEVAEMQNRAQEAKQKLEQQQAERIKIEEEHKQQQELHLRLAVLESQQRSRETAAAPSVTLPTQAASIGTGHDEVLRRLASLEQTLQNTAAVVRHTKEPPQQAASGLTPMHAFAHLHRTHYADVDWARIPHSKIEYIRTLDITGYGTFQTLETILKKARDEDTTRRREAARVESERLQLHLASVFAISQLQLPRLM